jgi:hypothetical protein
MQSPIATAGLFTNAHRNRVACTARHRTDQRTEIAVVERQQDLIAMSGELRRIEG